MALLWMDGFSYTATVAHIATQYPSPSILNLVMSAGNGRRGGNALSAVNTGGEQLKKVLSPSGAKCIVGYARSTNVLSQAQFLYVGDATVTHVTIRGNSDGSISAYRGSFTTLLGSSAAGAFTNAAGYFYFEAEVVVDDSAGSVKVWINEVLVLSLTSIDTRNGGTAGWTYFSIGGEGIVAHSTLYCDLYCFDGSGSENNAARGDTRIDSGHVPTANGNTGNSTPSTGSNRGATVDEIPPNTTDYNTIVSVGDKDTLALTDFAVPGGVPLGVKVMVYALKTDAGVGSMCPVLRVGGTDYDGTGQALNTTYGYQVTQVYNRDPSGAVWTEATFNAMEVGYKRTA